MEVASKNCTLRIPFSSKEYLGRHQDEVYKELKELGFKDIILKPRTVCDCVGDCHCRNNCITRISINGQTCFDRAEAFSNDAIIKISYNTQE